MSGVDDLEEGWFKDLMLRPTSRREFLKKLGKTGAALVGTKLLTSCGANAPPVEILPDTTSDDAMTIARSAYNLAKTFVDEPVLSGIQGLPTGQEMYDWLINAAKIHPEYYSRHKHPDSKIHIDERLMLDLSFIQAYFSADDFSQWKNDFTPFGIDLANEHVPKGVISRYKSVWEIYKTSFLKDCVEGKNTNGVINPQSFTALKEIREAANMFKTEVGTSILDKGTLEAIADQLPTDIRQGGIDLPLGVFDDVHIRFLIAHISEMYRLEHDVIEIEKQIENIIYGEETAVGKVPGIVDIWNSMAFTGKTISGEYAEFVKHADAFTNYYNNLDIGEKVKIKTNIGVSEEHKEKLKPLQVSHLAIKEKMTELFGEEWQTVCYGHELVKKDSSWLKAFSGEKMSILEVEALQDYSWATAEVLIKGSFSDVVKGNRLYELGGKYGGLHTKFIERQEPINHLWNNFIKYLVCLNILWMVDQKHC